MSDNNAFAQTTPLKSGLVMPTLGFGTWKLGENPALEQQEIAALHHAIDRGFEHFDTAEMYGDGDTERLLGKAFSSKDRSRLFITSKFYPHNADPKSMMRSCEQSLKYLQMDYLDLYLLHWPGAVPFEETLEGAARLLDQGKIRAFGISNFDYHGLSDIIAHGLHELIDVNQIMYNPARRGIEFDLLPLMQLHTIACVAYTPIEPRLIARNAPFSKIADDAGLTPAQLALAWHMTKGWALPIPKASTVAHVDALAEAANVKLTDQQLKAIDDVFPPPQSAQSLDIL